MRVVFVGRAGYTNHCIANWLADRHELVAYFRADVKMQTFEYRRKWLLRRINREGLLRGVDQWLYQLYYRAFERKRNYNITRRYFGVYFGEKAFDPPPHVPYYEYPNLNGDDALNALRDLKPDLVFALCVSAYLMRPWMEIPAYGTVLYHEGLTPEYKGLYTAFWANYNGEPEKIGYTLLQLNQHIDGGKPLAQGVGNVEPEYYHLLAYAGHRALVDGLPDVEKALQAIEQGKTPAVDRTPGPEGMYTYPGISDVLKMHMGRSHS